MKPITVHDGQLIIECKILINDLTITVLKKQRKYNKIVAEIQKLSHTNAKDKMILLEDLNKLYKQQLTDFTQIRQDLCLDIYSDLNDSELYLAMVDEKRRELSKLEIEINDLNTKINELEAQIPDTKEITQLKMNMKT